MPPQTEIRPASRSGGFRPSRRRSSWLEAGLALAVLATGPAPAFATSITVDLTVEFDSGAVGNYGRVRIEEVGGDLAFTIQLNSALGSNVDLHEFYFSLAGDFSDLQISTTDTPSTPYTLALDPSVAGGAGASFEYGVNFGNGAGRRGNGRLCCASFTLSAAESLAVGDLRVTTFAGGSTIAANMAAHVQGTSFVQNADSETVGGLLPPPTPIPEPGTGPLLALSLIGLAARQRARRGGARGSPPSVRAS